MVARDSPETARNLAAFVERTPCPRPTPTSAILIVDQIPGDARRAARAP